MKKGLKIKRKHNLYKPRKSPLKIALETTVFLAVCGVLIFAGYSVGKPVIDYVTGNMSIPEEAAATEPFVGDTTTITDTPADTTAAEPPQNTPFDFKHYAVLTADDLKDKAALAEALVRAEAEGATTALVVMKGEDGILAYKSVNPSLANLKMNIGTLTAKEIADMITTSGLTPAALVHTLKDPTAPFAILDAGYVTTDGVNWIDDTAAKGGKPWLNPQLPGARHYVAAVVGETAKGGFKTVVLSDTVYPKFLTYDERILPKNVSSDTRYTALTETYENCKDVAAEAGAVLAVEVNAADMGKQENGTDDMVGTAEILKGFAGTGDTAPADTATPSTDGDPSADTASADTIQVMLFIDDKNNDKAAELVRTARLKLPNADIFPVIDTKGLSEEQAKTAKEEAYSAAELPADKLNETTETTETTAATRAPAQTRTTWATYPTYPPATQPEPQPTPAPATQYATTPEPTQPPITQPPPTQPPPQETPPPAPAQEQTQPPAEQPQTQPQEAAQ